MVIDIFYIETSLTEKYSDIIYKIIKLQSNEQLIREHSINVDFLSSKLGTTKSHITYLLIIELKEETITTI